MKRDVCALARIMRQLCDNETIHPCGCNTRQLNCATVLPYFTGEGFDIRLTLGHLWLLEPRRILYKTDLTFLG